MLHSMRLMVKSWVAKALIALLVLSFAAWGIGDIFVSRSEGVVASVGDLEIDSYSFANAFHARLEQLARSGDEYDVSEAVRLGIDQTVLEEMGRRLALDNATAELGLSAPDSAVSERITSRPAFQDAAGRFDPDRYQRVLSVNQLSQKEFEATVRDDVSRFALIEAVATGSTLPKSFLIPVYGTVDEQRVFSYAVVKADPDKPVAPPTEAEIAEYLDENEADYRRPDEAEVAFLWLAPEKLADTEAVEEDEIREVYDLDIDLYTTQETRTLRQIVFETEAEATDARARLDAGETLLDLSEEMGLAPESVILGRVARDELAPELAESAFGESETGPVGPVEAAFGWAVQEIVALTEASTVPLDDVREEIALEIATDYALDRIPDMLALAEDRIAAGGSLEDVATALAVPLHVRTVDANGTVVSPDGETVPDDPEFLDAVFELQPGDDPDVISFDDGGNAVLRIDAHRESYVPPLDELRDDIVERLESAARKREAHAEAVAAEERIRAGETLEDVAESLGVEVVRSDPTKRYGIFTMPLAVIQRAFALEVGSHAVEEGHSEDAYLMRLDEIVEEDAAAIDNRVADLLPTFERIIDDEVFQAFSRVIGDDYPLRVNRAGVDAALGLLSDS